LSKDSTDPIHLPDFDTIDRFVTLTEAAKILGFGNYQSVNHLVDRKQLMLYKLPNTTRKRLLLSEISQLIEIQKKEKRLDDELGINRRNFPKRGRPRKY
jgi:hypothetical protein